jgi:hypothetical protein
MADEKLLRRISKGVDALNKWRDKHREIRELDLRGADLRCSVAESRQHFESLFEPDMSWRNYGSLWHIDHIRPVATFQPVEPETTGQVLPLHQPAFAAGCPEHAGVAQRTDGRAS